MARNVQELIDERNTLLHDLLEARARLAEVEALCAQLAEMTAELHRQQDRTDAALNEVYRLRDRLAEVEAELASEAEAHRHSAAGRAAAEARLAAVLAVPACRDVGHVETLHYAAGCCDPYETPCAAYEASVAAAGDRGSLGFSGLCPTCRGIGRHLDHCPSGVSTDPAPGRVGGNSAETPEPRPARGEGNQ